MNKQRTITMLVAIFGCLISGVPSTAADRWQSASAEAHIQQSSASQPKVAGSEGGRVNPEQHYLEIVALSAPSHLEAGRRLDVSLTAADARGIGFVEVQFGDELRRLDAGKQRLASFALSFETGRIGFQEIRVRAFAIDGRTSGPARTLDVSVTEAIKVVRTDASRIPDIDPQYTLDTGGVVSANPGLELDPNPGPWWIKWEKKYAKPFDWQSACGLGVGVTPNGEVLHCWLNKHPEVRAHLIWENIKYTAPDQWGTFMGEADPVAYDNWILANKNMLDEYFYHAYNYLQSGAVNYGGPAIPDVPDNQIVLNDAEYPATFFDSWQAKQLYMATVAHSLALEIGGFVPWSVTTYSGDDLELLFNSHYLMGVNYMSWQFNDGTRSHTGYQSQHGKDGGEVIPAPPVTTFNFLLANDLIRSNHINTAGRLFEWTHEHMSHVGYNSQSPLYKLPTLTQEAIWQYRGDAPAARMMAMTQYEDPITHQKFGNGKRSWADGCPGSSSFVQETLRAVNIPVTFVYPTGLTGHSTALFRTIGKTLMHGDDMDDGPYTRFTPALPGPAILVPIATFNDWMFNPNLPDPYYNIDRQLVEVALQYLSDDLLSRYCADKAANKTHANGSVFQFFMDGGYYSQFPYYTVQQLEAMKLWDNLAAKAANLNYCK